MMQVEIVNDGPVTITIDSEQTGSNTDEKKGNSRKTNDDLTVYLSVRLSIHVSGK